MNCTPYDLVILVTDPAAGKQAAAIPLQPEQRKPGETTKCPRACKRLDDRYEAVRRHYFMSADGKLVFVGSFNLDPPSVALNTEMGVLFENPELNQQMLAAFNEAVVTRAYQVQLDDAGDLVWLEHEGDQTLRYHKEPHSTPWQRFVARFLSSCHRACSD